MCSFLDYQISGAVNHMPHTLLSEFQNLNFVMEYDANTYINVSGADGLCKHFIVYSLRRLCSFSVSVDTTVTNQLLPFLFIVNIFLAGNA
jgi:hypothetical protein